ncbi:glycosyltransferase family 2 protein [Alphaproteobacteria bacterium]|nr:glycosyltransferase family 2 protein [Alphaproteobacteria bacterium]
MIILKFSLIVPLWNEGKNVVDLVDMIADSSLPADGLGELILVNNGSTDDTGKYVNAGAAKHSWIVPVHLDQNLNYGGGVYEGFKYATNDILAYIPGDLQVMADDVLKVWKTYSDGIGDKNNLFVKGNRTVRHDPFQTQFISAVYTILANIVLGLRVKDVNGLPKLFHRSLMDLVPTVRMKTFVFDSQIISLARVNGWTIKEVPVTFHSRREGLSSWSNKRMQVYITIFKQLIELRTLRYTKGVKLERLRW